MNAPTIEEIGPIEGYEIQGPFDCVRNDPDGKPYHTAMYLLLGGKKGDGSRSFVEIHLDTDIMDISHDRAEYVRREIMWVGVEAIKMLLGESKP